MTEFLDIEGGRIAYDVAGLGGIMRIRRYRRGTLALSGVMLLHSLRSWMRYLDVAYPHKPADYDA